MHEHYVLAPNDCHTQFISLTIDIQIDRDGDDSRTVASSARVHARVLAAQLREKQCAREREWDALVAPGEDGSGVSLSGAGERVLCALHCRAVGGQRSKGGWHCGGGAKKPVRPRIFYLHNFMCMHYAVKTIGLCTSTQ